MRVGVLGGGQLGRMLALAGIPLGATFVFYGPEAQPPAGVAGAVVRGEWDDEEALDRFVTMVDVVTLEFENVPLGCARWLAARRPFWPPPSILEVAQDRVAEKRCFQRLGIPVPAFAEVDTPEQARRAAAELGAPGILKTRRFGYDGKGQLRVSDPDDAADACAVLGGVPLIYERVVPFTRELSVIAARGADGRVVVYPLAENHHHRGILRESIAPAPGVAPSVEAAALRHVSAVLEEFGYVGVLALELFETSDGLIANEMAPRVHNSGHWTIEGAAPSQFENHVRAVCGLPVGVPQLAGAARMLNVLGALPDSSALLAISGVRLHLYGKRPAPGRKLGHVTVVSPDPEATRDVASVARRFLGDASPD